MSDSDAKGRLSPEQYHVCFEKGTERPFSGEYWDFKGDGVFHCINCGRELFDTKTKFDSGTGWPSFWDVISSGNVRQQEDRSHGMQRIEVLCAHCGAHLGHLFPDGPPPTGLRYCINSAALKFVPRDEE